MRYLIFVPWPLAQISESQDLWGIQSCLESCLQSKLVRLHAGSECNLFLVPVSNPSVPRGSTRPELQVSFSCSIYYSLVGSKTRRVDATDRKE